MPHFAIVSSAGVNLGTYEAANADAALDAMARAAGYRDAEHAAEVAGDFDGDVIELRKPENLWWRTVARYVVTFPADFGADDAADVSVQIAEWPRIGAWLVRTTDDANGSDEGPAQPYATEEEAEAAAVALAARLDEGAGSESAAAYLDARAERAILALVQQDTAGETDDSYARTGDALDTIRRWREAADDAGDTALVEAIDRLGEERAADIYRAARG